MGNFVEFIGLLKCVLIWVGKCFDWDNFDIYFIDSDIMFFGGIGGGINDVDWGSGLCGDYLVYVCNFGDFGSDNYVDNDI